ncbi:HesA/MoeB/ThiF family protein [Novosphingobium rosa]|uniref:HesA/MoeB/ThiF family protein n=1 Tax=Novosphingobium rosa TaxID=76978 RepID=UPI000A7737A9|nr:HesA/MoeB/ThiF family protein [Novosphingobium rosa]
MILPPERLSRFARHIILPEVGGAGQLALAQAHVVLVGCGGIGSPALQYLAAAGIGRFTLIDDDVVEDSNLQRQTIFSTADLGKSKAQAAADWVKRFDPALSVTVHQARITAENAATLIGQPTLVLDGCDNFATRLAVSDACVALGTALTSAAVGRFQGQIANFAGHLPGQPCYRCYVGDAFDAQDCDTCAADGVLGAFVGMVGTFAAMHAIRIVMAQAGASFDGTGLGDPQWGKLMLLDGLAPALRPISLVKDPACKGCSG